MQRSIPSGGNYRPHPQIMESHTNKSYDSLFTKWECWCSEWDSDPISDPVTEVANFLAYLFKGGYQYGSINSY